MLFLRFNRNTEDSTTADFTECSTRFAYQFCVLEIWDVLDVLRLFVICNLLFTLIWVTCAGSRIPLHMLLECVLPAARGRSCSCLSSIKNSCYLYLLPMRVFTNWNHVVFMLFLSDMLLITIIALKVLVLGKLTTIHLETKEFFSMIYELFQLKAF